MYWVDNGTGVTAPPTIPPVQSSARQYFTEGGQGQQPTIPGGDWFNMVTDELISVLTAAEIIPAKGKHNQLITAFNVIMLDFIDVVFPVGIPFPWPLAELPPVKHGITFVKANGAAFNKELNPKLAKIYPSGRVIDLRGTTIRALDDGRGFDPGRVLLSYQSDEVKEHLHYISAKYAGGTGQSAIRILQAGFESSPEAPTSQYNTSGVENLDFSPAGGSETRVKSYALNYIMRAS